MERKFNLRVVGTCRNSRKLFDSEQLLFDKCHGGTSRVLLDKCLGTVITRWKYGKTLRGVSTKMTKCVGEVTRNKERD